MALGSLKKTPETSRPPISSSSGSPNSIGVCWATVVCGNATSRDRKTQEEIKRLRKESISIKRFAASKTNCNGYLLFKVALVGQLFADLAKPALAFLVIENGCIKQFPVKIRPVYI